MERSPHYIIRGGVEGRERLRVISRVLSPSTLALLERVGVAEGMTCLDVGCGGGDTTLALAGRAGTSGQVVGVDIDPTKLELARGEAAAAGVDNVEYRHGDVVTCDLGSGFDLVYARFLLTHLPDAGSACERLARAARPGGVVVVEDIDYAGNFCYPPSEAYERHSDLFVAAARARGCDATIGPRLGELLRAAGCEEIGMSMVQPIGARSSGHEGDVKLAVALTMENIADAVVAGGHASRAEVDEVVDELYRLAADDRTVMSFPRIVQAWGSTAR